MFWQIVAVGSILTTAVLTLDHGTQSAHEAAHRHDPTFDHQVFLGQDQALEFAQQTPQKSKERLSKILPKIDRDGDKLISEDELAYHIDRMALQYVENDVKRMWPSFQTKNGTLSLADYKFQYVGAPDPNWKVPEEFLKQLEKDEKRWKVADLNGDGLLNKEEYKCLIHSEYCGHMKPHIAQERLDDMDKNKDGALDVMEYIGDIYHPEEKDLTEEPGWMIYEKDVFKKYRDLDGDGKMNVTEVLEWLFPKDYNHPKVEAQHLIRIADDNKDGKLSFNEIIDHYDTFVGSQATNYGQTLKHDPSEL